MLVDGRPQASCFEEIFFSRRCIIRFLNVSRWGKLAASPKFVNNLVGACHFMRVCWILSLWCYECSGDDRGSNEDAVHGRDFHWLGQLYHILHSEEFWQVRPWVVSDCSDLTIATGSGDIQPFWWCTSALRGAGGLPWAHWKRDGVFWIMWIQVPWQEGHCRLSTRGMPNQMSPIRTWLLINFCKDLSWIGSDIAWEIWHSDLAKDPRQNTITDSKFLIEQVAT